VFFGFSVLKCSSYSFKKSINKISACLTGYMVKRILGVFAALRLPGCRHTVLKAKQVEAQKLRLAIPIQDGDSGFNYFRLSLPTSIPKKEKDIP